MMIFKKFIRTIIHEENSNGNDRDHQSMGVDLNFNVNKLLVYTYLAQTENTGDNKAASISKSSALLIA